MNVQTFDRQTSMELRDAGFWARAIAKVFHRRLDRLDQAFLNGGIEAALPDGSFRILGCRAPGPVARVDLKSWRALIRLANSGSAGWYEAWEAGEWDSPDPVPLFDLFMRNRATLGRQARASGLARLWRWSAHRLRRNDKARAPRNIMAHYDLGNDFYAAWLDATMSYSSAIFALPISEAEPLEAAQARKIEALIARLDLSPSARVLEVGCGWGHLSHRLAASGHAVTAITLSPAQKAWAEAKGTGPRFQIRDYRDVDGRFDAIVSVEMVEAVGREYWRDYVGTLSNCLKPGGRAAIQFITIADDVFEAYAASADFIQSYVFPGGMLVSESRFRALAEAEGLAWHEPVRFGLHYAETLKRWRERFDAAVAERSLPPQFDERFIRLWRYYLQYCEGGFRGGGIDVMQVTLIKSG